MAKLVTNIFLPIPKFCGNHFIIREKAGKWIICTKILPPRSIHKEQDRGIFFRSYQGLVRVSGLILIPTAGLEIPYLFYELKSITAYMEKCRKGGHANWKRNHNTGIYAFVIDAHTCFKMHSNDSKLSCTHKILREC